MSGNSKNQEVIFTTAALVMNKKTGVLCEVCISSTEGNYIAYPGGIVTYHSIRGLLSLLAKFYVYIGRV